ncbi:MULTISPECIES: family 14 glycosylhydrolase [Subtercola]|uniref:Beta-amylase n=1 Tax=Subtercola vilae TaxID=2056433 RepID=A0A4V4RGY3_9MICO|nr:MULTISPECIES: family 14 glycosylhydrolase [Subtercola]MEA9987256.1 family 14 glycosylhydrolase [Subtercola sp. RTI3]TIH36894.1 glycosyl hydrolase family protein [Subtercola vilae]
MKIPTPGQWRTDAQRSPQHSPQRSPHRKSPRIGRLGRRIAVLGATAALAAGVITLPNAALASPGDSPTVVAMARLQIPDWQTKGPEWQAFVRQLDEFKKMGGTGIEEDVWWGKAALSPTTYDWAYYDQTFSAIVAAGLSIVPIMSFHSCGTGVGDSGDCATPIPLPSFVTAPVNYGGILGTRPADNFYQSEYGNVSTQAVAPWGMAAPRSYQYMKNFMNAFEDHFGAGFSTKISEIAVSTGPAGELREPSYDAQDAGVAGTPGFFPNRGILQVYSPAARASFVQWVLAKYGSVAGAGSAWGIPGLTLSTISPPDDHDRFFTSGAYLNSSYGHDLTQWNNESLVNHGRTILDEAIEAFDGSLAHTPLSIKIPGVHWQTMASSPIRRAPEVAAGLISTNVDVNSDATGHGYDTILNMVHDADVHGDGVSPVTHHVVLHFTELEKPNIEWDGSAHAYSAAADQVGWIADAAAAEGVQLKGENALNGGLYSDGDASSPGWSHIRTAFDRDPVKKFSGLTVLRLPDIASGGFAETEMTNFIRDYK